MDAPRGRSDRAAGRCGMEQRYDKPPPPFCLRDNYNCFIHRKRNGHLARCVVCEVHNFLIRSEKTCAICFAKSLAAANAAVCGGHGCRKERHACRERQLEQLGYHIPEGPWRIAPTPPWASGIPEAKREPEEEQEERTKNKTAHWTTRYRQASQTLEQNGGREGWQKRHREDTDDREAANSARPKQQKTAPGHRSQEAETRSGPPKPAQGLQGAVRMTPRRGAEGTATDREEPHAWQKEGKSVRQGK